MKKYDYDWWFNRIKFLSNYVDIIGIEHFKGFSKSWEIDAQETTAIHGAWFDGPREDFLSFLK